MKPLEALGQGPLKAPSSPAQTTKTLPWFTTVPKGAVVNSSSGFQDAFLYTSEQHASRSASMPMSDFSFETFSLVSNEKSEILRGPWSEPLLFVLLAALEEVLSACFDICLGAQKLIQTRNVTVRANSKLDARAVQFGNQAELAADSHDCRRGSL